MVQFPLTSFLQNIRANQDTHASNTDISVFTKILIVP